MWISPPDRLTRQQDQDCAAGGRAARTVPLSGGHAATASVELQHFRKSRRVYAYLRFKAAGRTLRLYIGEVQELRALRRCARRGTSRRTSNCSARLPTAPMSASATRRTMVNPRSTVRPVCGLRRTEMDVVGPAERVDGCRRAIMAAVAPRLSARDGGVRVFGQPGASPATPVCGSVSGVVRRRSGARVCGRALR